MSGISHERQNSSTNCTATENCTLAKLEMPPNSWCCHFCCSFIILFLCCVSQIISKSVCTIDDVYSLLVSQHLFIMVFSARYNIYISHLCYDVSVRLSVTEVHWRIIANLGFKFQSQFSALRSQCMRAVHERRDHLREECRDHLALC